MNSRGHWPNPRASGRACRLTTILPPLTLEETLETTKIHSIAGLLKPGRVMAWLNKRQRSRKVEAIQVHHLGPSRDKVVDELLPGVGTSVHFSQGAELGV